MTTVDPWGGFRYHAKALLVTFDTDNDNQAKADALTREIQTTFKRLDRAIRELAEGSNADADAQVRVQVQRQLAQVGHINTGM